jgi:hypothetical protein
MFIAAASRPDGERPQLLTKLKLERRNPAERSEDRLSNPTDERNGFCCRHAA